MIACTCAALIGILTQIVVAQSGVVGRVVDSLGQPMPGVTVMMLPAAGGQQIQTMTGGDGTYRFEKVPDGMYRIDFELLGFEMIRRNSVAVRNGRSAIADATLRIRPICECVMPTGLPRVVEKTGLVLDSEGRPLPRARLEMVVPLRVEPGVNRSGSANTWREVAYTDAEGRFSFVAPLNGTWPLTVSDSGFRPVTQLVSGAMRDPLVIRLTFVGANPASQSDERIDQGCGCPGNLFGSRTR